MCHSLDLGEEDDSVDRPQVPARQKPMISPLTIGEVSGKTEKGIKGNMPLLSGKALDRSFIGA